ncbi:GMC family oxidoreductase N-terminal domain-containing protein [Noviherbaspirillum denitrificans]|uniref:Cholesterol oxidase n=1 Tax=Noviherbaspirillum denitrificans TaxID=1968433 RepID=A0A254TCV3_9BURK|nr:GMC family oxidoreductase N-terminal domain-containing protein [Noviherbaspirillum denitrificans]OWW20471.1 cholesterol oxidase [Noviherbaspirillum denitrificans]
MSTTLQHEAVVIGSGFGGGVLSARLSRQWPGKVLILERGKEYPLGAYPRSPADMADNVWCPDGDTARRPRHVRRRKAQRGHLTGMFDIRHFDKIDTVTSAVYGGGSQIYANVFLRPPEAVFEQGWPAGVRREVLAPYYDVAQQVLGARPVPPASSEDDRRYIRRTERFQQFAQEAKLPTRMADICVYFGNDYSYRGSEQPLPLGVQQANRYGTLQTSCTYCGECDIGCNVQAKNSVDHNYLHVARHRYNAAVRTQCEVERIVPLDASQADDPDGDGYHGYRVYFRDLRMGGTHSVTTRRVVVSAGTLGTNELLMRNRDVHKTLPRISQRLGKQFSGNGDFLAFAVDGKKEVNSTYGPVITQYTDHHLYKDLDRKQAFLLQDASYPTQVGWATAALGPVMNPFDMIWTTCKQVLAYAFDKFYPGRKRSSVGYMMQKLFSHDLSEYSAVLLCMGLDNAKGVLSLNKDGYLDIDWPQESNSSLYDAIINLGERFTQFIGGKHYVPMPNWLWPIKNNVTVHPLGGCALAESPEQGVVSAVQGSRGQVFGYHGLYVADGSLMPTALGANPVATITALSEWIAHDITGVTPDAGL